MPKTNIEEIKIKVASSTLLNSGWGLFAKQKICSGTKITEFDGTIVTPAEARDLENIGKGAHLKTLARGHLILNGDFNPFLPESQNKGLASFANDPSVTIDESGIPRKRKRISGEENKKRSKNKNGNKRKSERKSKSNARTKSLFNSKFVTKWVERRKIEKLQTNSRYDCLEKVFLVATREIKEDEEIFVAYGDDYWRKRGMF